MPVIRCFSGGFPSQQSALANPAPAIISHHAGFADDAVARDQISQRILSHGSPDGAGGGRISHRFGQTAVSGELAGRNLQKRAPDPDLKGRAGDEGAQRRMRIPFGRKRKNLPDNSSGKRIILPQPGVAPVFLKLLPRGIFTTAINKRQMTDAARAS